MNNSPENIDFSNEDFDSLMDKMDKRDEALRSEKAKLIARAKADKPKKEAFDADKLKKLFNYADLMHTGVESDSQEARMQLEEKYYLQYPEINTIEEFAEKLKMMDAMGGS